MNKEEEFDVIAREVFFPLYAVIAEDAVNVLNGKNGKCLDIGCGGGFFGLHVAKITEMDILFCDYSENAISICDKRREEWGLNNRTASLVCDVHRLDIPSNLFDLIVSRSSIGFWGDEEEVKKAFSELYRVLALGGVTYIGRGFGNKEIYNEIVEKMKIYNPAWPGSLKSITNNLTTKDYKKILNELEIKFEMVEDESGNWIIMKK